MKRLCTNCNTETDFVIKSTKDLDNLRCPVCDAKVDKNSKVRGFQEDRVMSQGEKTVADAIAIWFMIVYYFYAACSVVALIFYAFKLYKACIICTGIVLAIYLLQLFVGRRRFKSGIIIIPIAAFLTYTYYDNTVQGACLGILLSFLGFHLIRLIWIGIIRWLINLGK